MSPEIVSKRTEISPFDLDESFHTYGYGSKFKSIIEEEVFIYQYQYRNVRKCYPNGKYPFKNYRGVQLPKVQK